MYSKVIYLVPPALIIDGILIEMKQLGIISITLLWMGLIFLIRKWKGNVSMTFSQHAAQYKSSQIYYFVLFAATLPFFSLFLYKWFIPTFKLSFFFGLIAGVGMIGQLIAVIVPETEGKKVPVHRYSAFIMSDCLVPLSIFIATSSNFSKAARILAILTATFQLVQIIILFPTKAYHPKVLYLQASYVAAFHLTILAATYLR